MDERRIEIAEAVMLCIREEDDATCAFLMGWVSGLVLLGEVERRRAIELIVGSGMYVEVQRKLATVAVFGVVKTETPT